jgi:hypothetical protein
LKVLFGVGLGVGVVEDVGVTVGVIVGVGVLEFQLMLELRILFP